MKAMVLKGISNFKENNSPLKLSEMRIPVPGDNEILIKVSVCGVCHTELDEIEGRTPPSRFPIIPGHQVIGRIENMGKNVTSFKTGDRVGAAWIYFACGKCKYCTSGNENLCPYFKATGRDADGGYAECMLISQNFAYHIPPVFTDSEAAPLLCAGAIGYRSLRLTGLVDGQSLGLTGFGASSHLVLKMAKHRFPNSRIFVFARSEHEREFAKELGAVWSGDTSDESPEKLHSIIDTTPVWKPVVEALKNLEPGGRLVINAIGKEELDKDYLLKLNYPAHLWLEKEIKSVANVCRSDVIEFLALAGEMHIRPEVKEFDLKDANEALNELRTRGTRGAKVLRVR
jgi:propanol-preferring alcohol dehydrogenase